MTTNHSVGHQAEAYAAEFLKSKGFEIIQLNWRTRNCEIDIVCKHRKSIYFVEVKYRKNAEQGSGLDYITPTKLRQMGFAAEMWVSQNSWAGQYQLGAIEVAGTPFQVAGFVTELTL